jgi:hypothetical protein
VPVGNRTATVRYMIAVTHSRDSRLTSTPCQTRLWSRRTWEVLRFRHPPVQSRFRFSPLGCIEESVRPEAISAFGEGESTPFRNPNQIEPETPFPENKVTPL